MSIVDVSRVERSALWSAYGDALGFMTELTDQGGLVHRTGRERVEDTLPWRRVIGGRSGASVLLPAGTISDDTQLRLATSRAIKDGGYFDVEAFAKIELPVWTSYALGAGRSTKAAASNLARSDINWFSNFFQVEKSDYLNAGGNGPASRIQPHVWGAPDLEDWKAITANVVKNAICTHGHMRSIVGAVFHALCLAFALQTGRAPGPTEWRQIILFQRYVVEAIRADNDLSSFWLPAWEARTGERVGNAIDRACAELNGGLKAAGDIDGPLSAEEYHGLLRRLDALSEGNRGSGLITPLIASVVSYASALDENFTSPIDTLRMICNALGSDTDTIATMAGAILGCGVDNEPQGEIMDRDYIRSEAVRVQTANRSGIKTTFRYPDLIRWAPPKNGLDALKEADGSLVVEGIGKVIFTGEEFHPRGKQQNVYWQWVRLEFGQTLLLKRRRTLSKAKPEMTRSSEKAKGAPANVEPLPLLRVMQPPVHEEFEHARKDEILSLECLTTEVIEANFDPTLIGRHLRHLSRAPDGIERGIAYTSIVMKAMMSRRKRRREGTDV